MTINFKDVPAALKVERKSDMARKIIGYFILSSIIPLLGVLVKCLWLPDWSWVPFYKFLSTYYGILGAAGIAAYGLYLIEGD